MIIEFEKSKGSYVFRDALHLPDNHNLSIREIEDMKQTRFDAWLELVTASHENPDPEQEIDNG